LISLSRYNLLTGEEKALLLTIVQKYYQPTICEAILRTIKEPFIKQYLESANKDIDKTNGECYPIFNSLRVKFGFPDEIVSAPIAAIENK